MSEVYSHGTWTVKDGEGDQFVEAWTTFADWLSDQPGSGTARLTRDLENPNKYLSFAPWESIHEANPQEILERKEKVGLPPLLIMQGALDDNVLPEMQEKFAKTYRKAGGICEYHLFENAVHEWVAEPGLQTDKAREKVKEFVARQVTG